MPTLQVLDRQEDQGTSQYQGFMKNIQGQQKMLLDFTYKQGMLKTYKEQNKINAQNAQNETDKLKFQRKVGIAEMIDKTFSDGRQVFKNDPDKIKEYVTKRVFALGPEAMEILGGEEMAGLMSRAGLTGEEAKKFGEAEQDTAQAGMMNRVEAASGGQGGGQGGWMAESVGPSGPNYVNLGAEEAKTAARERGKAPTMEETRGLSNTETILNALDALDPMIDKGVLDGLPTQALADISNPMIATNPRLREAITLLNHVKSLVPFARGGKQLTPFEAKLVFRLVNVKGKTRAQIKRDLNVYRTEFMSIRDSILGTKGGIKDELTGSAAEKAANIAYKEMTEGASASSTSRSKALGGGNQFTIEEIQ